MSGGRQTLQRHDEKNGRVRGAGAVVVSAANLPKRCDLSLRA